MTDIAVTQSFQERIFEKIKKDIGELMTDEDLKRLVQAAMQDAFFKERRESRGYGHDIKPPVLVEMVRELMRQQMDAALRDWLEKNKEEVLKVLDEQLMKGATNFLRSALDSFMSNAFYQFSQALKSSMLPGMHT